MVQLLRTPYDNIIRGFRGIKKGEIMEDIFKICFECAYCSEHYPSMKDSCDIDEHEIKDVFAETCEKFVKAYDYGVLAD